MFQISNVLLIFLKTPPNKIHYQISFENFSTVAPCNKSVYDSDFKTFKITTYVPKLGFSWNFSMKHMKNILLFSPNV